MRTSHPNVAMIATVARRLGDLCGEVVFVGGATTSLFVTEPGAPQPRATAAGFEAYRSDSGARESGFPVT